VLKISSNDLVESILLVITVKEKIKSMTMFSYINEKAQESFNT
jgi:hypothetical protein